MVRRLASLIVMAVFVAGSARTAGAQESASAGIAGQVLDATRAAVPGATVTVINAGTNAQRVVITDSEGRFTVPNLPGATYAIRVELPGFQTVELKDFILRNGEIAKPTLTMALANVSETVTVVGVSPLLQVANASVSQTITQKQIEDLPVTGRNLLAFAALSAGVTPQAFNRGTQFGAAGSSRSGGRLVLADSGCLLRPCRGDSPLECLSLVGTVPPQGLSLGGGSLGHLVAVTALCAFAVVPTRSPRFRLS